MKNDSINLELAPNAQWVHETSAEVKIKQINGHTDSISSCQLINNDQVIFTSSNDNTARLWDFHSGKELNVYPNLHDLTIPKACVNHSNTKFVSCSWDRKIKCWDLVTGQLLWKNEHEYLLSSCAFSNNDSKYVVSVSDVDFFVKIWDVHTGHLVMNIKGRIYLVSVSPKIKLSYNQNYIHKSTITACGFSPKNDRIVTTSMDKTTNFYDIIAKKSTISLGGHNCVISNYSYTPDERKLGTCSWDKQIQIWDIATGMYRKNGPITLTNGHEGSISSCQISNDGSICVSGGYDTRLVLWDMDHAIPKLILRGHSGWINDVCLTNDNKWIVSVGKDSQIREWDILNRENIKLVVEQNKNLGNKLITCSNCNRLFTIAKLEKTSESKMYCVFCRLQERRSETSTTDNHSSSRSSLIANSQLMNYEK